MNDDQTPRPTRILELDPIGTAHTRDAHPADTLVRSVLNPDAVGEIHLHLALVTALDGLDAFDHIVALWRRENTAGVRRFLRRRRRLGGRVGRRCPLVVVKSTEVMIDR